MKLTRVGVETKEATWVWPFPRLRFRLWTGEWCEHPRWDPSPTGRIDGWTMVNLRDATDAAVRRVPVGGVAMSTTSFAGWLSFTLYFGAAMHDATHEQRAQLNTRITPLIEKMRDDDPGVWKPAVSQVFVEIGAVMGSGWGPSGDWKRQIDLLLKDE